MSHLRAIYHLRRVLARSYAETELDFYTQEDPIDHGLTGSGGGWVRLASQPDVMTAKWNDGPVFYEVTAQSPDGHEALVDFKLLQ